MMAGPMVGMATLPTTTTLAVRREKRRKRKIQDIEHTGDRDVIGKMTVPARHGFQFDELPSEKPDRAAQATPPPSAVKERPSTAHTFVFHVKKMQKKEQGGATPAQTLQEKKEREARRERIKRMKKQMEEEEQYEAGLAAQLSADQIGLYRTMRYCVRRELRRTKQTTKQSTRADIALLTEKSLATVKTEIVAFMKETPPSSTMVTVPNSENARLAALIESYEKRIAVLAEEEAKWKQMNESIGTQPHAASSERETILCDLEVASQVEQRQVTALSRVQASAHRLQLVEDSMQTVHRLLLQANLKRSQLFDAFHSSAFKGYMHMAHPKDTLRALFKLPPPNAQAS